MIYFKLFIFIIFWLLFSIIFNPINFIILKILIINFILIICIPLIQLSDLMRWFSLKTVISLQAWLSLSWPPGKVGLRLFEFRTCRLLRRIFIELIELFFYFLVILVVIFVVDSVIYHILLIF
jgi:hypothetical protein